MTKDVLVTVRGTQSDGEREETTEIVCNGTYYFKNGKHYILYDEIQEQEQSPIATMVKIGGEPDELKMEVTKKGSVTTAICFQAGINNMAFYETEYGSFTIGFHAGNIYMTHEEDRINIRVDYAMEINCEHVSDNVIEIEAVSKHT